MSGARAPIMNAWSTLHRNPMRIALLALAAGACVATGAIAGPSTAALTDFAGLFVDSSVGQQQRLCSIRLPDTATQWRADLQRWRAANAEPLRELRETGQALRNLTARRAVEASPGMSLEEREGQLAMYSGFMMIAVTQPAVELATANDAQAAERCEKWRAAIAPSGGLESGLSRAIEGAKRLLHQAQEAPH